MSTTVKNARKESLTSIWAKETLSITGIVKFLANDEKAQKRLHELHTQMNIEIPIKSFTNKKWLLDEFKRIDIDRKKEDKWLLSEVKNAKGEFEPRTKFSPFYIELVLRANRNDK